MFKSPLSFFWGKPKATTTTTTTKATLSTNSHGSPASTSSPKTGGPVTQAFTIAGKGASMLRVSMIDSETDNDDGFVDVQFRKLSYAEVASLAPSRKRASPTATPAAGRRTSINEYEVLQKGADVSAIASVASAANSRSPLIEEDSKVLDNAIVHIEEDLPEKFKSDVHYRKGKKKKTRKPRV